MSADNLTPLGSCAGAAALKEIARRTWLSAPHAAVHVTAYWIPARGGKATVRVEYKGSPEGLLGAECAVAPLLEARPPKRDAASLRARRAEYPSWWFTYRSPTKRHPRRLKVCYQFGDDVDLGAALNLPGMRQLFPEGFPELRSEAETTVEARPATLREWEERQRGCVLDSILQPALAVLEARVVQASGVESSQERLRDLYPVDRQARFRWRREELTRMRQFVLETEARFRALLLSMRGEDTRHSRLQVVVDNTRSPRP